MIGIFLVITAANQTKHHQLIITINNRKLFQTKSFRNTAQQIHTEGMKGRGPQSPGLFTQCKFDTRHNFTGCTAGKGQNLNLVGRHTLLNQVSCACHDSLGFATTCPGQHQTVFCFCGRCLLLLGV